MTISAFNLEINAQHLICFNFSNVTNKLGFYPHIALHCIQLYCLFWKQVSQRSCDYLFFIYLESASLNPSRIWIGDLSLCSHPLCHLPCLILSEIITSSFEKMEKDQKLAILIIKRSKSLFWQNWTLIWIQFCSVNSNCHLISAQFSLSLDSKCRQFDSGCLIA